MHTGLWILTCMLAGGSAQAAELRVASDTIEARAQGCATCHGPHGEGVKDLNFPRIAGKPAGYLLNQLRNFRDGQRSYPPMNYLVAYLHDDYLEELANYFAAQGIKQAPPVERSAAASAAGERLVRQGDEPHNIPACVLCHGKSLTGIEPGIPGLVGLNSRYIAAQLVSWRVGTRHAKKPDCMREIASRLSETDIGEVSAWLAAQPAPTQAGPAVVGSWKTALPCGSEPSPPQTSGPPPGTCVPYETRRPAVHRRICHADPIWHAVLAQHYP
jgi:cytochrome c553